MMLVRLSAAWRWVKDHWEAVVVAMVAAFAGFFAWGAYRRSTGRLRDAIAVEKVRTEVARLETKRDAQLEKEWALAQEDDALDERIRETKRDAVAARESVEGKTDAEVVARFNELYPRR